MFPMIANDTLRLDTDADTRISNGPGVRKIPIVARCQAAYLAVEGGYTYLGEYAFAGQVIADPGTVSANLQADDWNAFAVGILPLNERFDVFAKLGIGYWTADLATSGTFAGRSAQSADSSGTDRIVGLGARFNITARWGIRAEWERFFNVGSATTSGETDIDFWSLGVQYRF